MLNTENSSEKMIQNNYRSNSIPQNKHNPLASSGAKEKVANQYGKM